MACYVIQAIRYLTEVDGGIITSEWGQYCCTVKFVDTREVVAATLLETSGSGFKC